MSFQSKTPENRDLRPSVVPANIQRLISTYPSSVIPHGELTHSLEAAAEFAADETPTKGDYFRQQFSDFTTAVSDVPGYVGVLGTGYPFYAEKEDGGVHRIKEIERYTRTFLPLVEKDAARGYGNWICGACQIDVELPDLKTQCKPCKQVDFKPRDAFKVLPDVDYWVIVDPQNGDTTEAERQIEENTAAIGFYTSDKDIVGGIKKTVEVMDALHDGHMPTTRLPIDLHLITKKQLMGQMVDIPAAIETGAEVPITARSLHVTWEDTDVPYDLKKDFIFSFTEEGIRDPELAEAIDTTRRKAKQAIGDRAGQIIADCSPKEARQLETPAILSNLEQRISGW